MSQKTLRGSHQEGQTAGQPETSFASLPEPVVAHIAHLSKQRPGPPLMGVSSSCRDAVLSSLTSVRLHPLPASEAPFSPGPHARLLHRACCQARPGLQVELILWRHCGSLPQLLQPGIEYGGWRNVHKLKVWWVPDSAHLLIQAFPALTEMDLFSVDLGDGALFSMLAAQPACPLSSIILRCCDIKGTAVDAAAAALARLPSLKAYHVEGPQVPLVPLRVASQLTGLTHLGGGLEAGVPPPDTQLVKAVKRNKGLQSLTVHDTQSESLSAEVLQHLLMSGSHLTQLDLSDQRVDDQGLDILLQHGSNITDLKLGGVDVSNNRADSKCRWQRLWLDDRDPLLAGLAYLPLKSVQELASYNPAETLHLAFIPSPQLVPLLQQAVSNLVACPAWQKQPATRVLLYTHILESAATIPDSQVAQLLSALSPLGGPHLQHLAISMNTEFGQQEVQVLARSLGSGLRSLSLRRGVIKPSFWPALSQHLPHLKELGLVHKVEVNSMGMVAYLRTLAQPFTLYIGPGVLADYIVADLTDTIDAWQMQGVSVKQEYPADECDFDYPDELEGDWDRDRQQEAGSQENSESEQEEASSEGDEEAEVVDDE